MSNDTTSVRYGSVAVDGLNIAYREAGNPANPKLVLLHGFPASSHQYRDLIRVLADSFHLIAPDYPGFGLSDIPDPASFSYTFDRIAQIIARFLEIKGFESYGLFVQDYGGPVGFRLVDSKPDALEWLIVQNSNAYEVGFTAAWDGLRNALWKNRSEETEAPLHGFLTRDTIRTIYLHGTQRPELLSPDSWESDIAFMQRPNAVALESRFVLRLPHERSTLSRMAGVSAGAAAGDDHLLGSGRHLLHSRRWRRLPARTPVRRDAPARCRSFPGRG